jgi:hypothetical protein
LQGTKYLIPENQKEKQGMTVTVTQKKYLNFLAEAIKVANRNEMPVDNLKDTSFVVQQSEFLVPLIGGFSAGKSTLINALIGREVLPVDISPETELAAEIRYADQDAIHAIKKDGSLEQYSIDQFSEIKKKPRQYSHLRVYLNSGVLKAIQPMVLVDMPGFGSAIGAHAEALAHYMSRGAYYIATISATEGAIPASMLAELAEIEALGRSVGFVVTKSNLKSEEDVAAVCEHIEVSVQAEMQQEAIIHQCGFEADGLLALIDGLDRDGIARELFAGAVEDAHLRTLEGLQMRASGLDKSLVQIREAREGLEKAISLLERQKGRKLEEIDGASSTVIARLCVKKVASAMEAATPELVEMIKQKDTQGVEQRLFALVRSSVTSVLRREMTQYSNDVVEDLGRELHGLDASLSGFDTGAWVENIVEAIKARVSEFEAQLDRIQGSLEKVSEAGKVYRAVTTVLAVCTSVVVPALEILLIFLPDIIKLFAQADMDKKVREGIQNEMIPQIRGKLEEVIPSMVEDQMRQMVESAAQEFEGRINEKRAVLESMETDQQDEAEKKTALESIKSDIASLRELAKENIYAGAA